MLNAFRSSGRSKGTSILVWIILGLLVVGLTGFGLGGAVSGLASQNVARVNGEKIETATFVRLVDQQRQRLSQEFQRPITMAQAQLFGIDQQVLGQLVTQAALDDQMADLKISAGDAVVRDQLMATQAFQGVSGGFDQTAYDFFLRQSGLSAREYEDQLRKDAARTLLDVAVASGLQMPDVFGEAVLKYANEERRFSVVRLTEADLETPIEAPTDADLQAHYTANPDEYTAPETRIVSYAALTPAQLGNEIEITDEQIAALYDSRSETYARPELRVFDLIGFGTEAEAAEAKAAIEAGELTFDGLAESRGLTAADLSAGTVAAEDLGATAREVVFGAEGPGVLGPVQTDLGPSLYRLNAILAAQTQTLEDVREDLRTELAQDAALDELVDLIEPVEDLLAAGATLEEIAQETPLAFGELALTSDVGEGLAGDLAFRREAFEAEVGEERDLVELGEGGIAALRVERVDPPALRPYDEVADQVAADWRGAQISAALATQAAALKAALDEGRQLAPLAEELDLREMGPVTRRGQVDTDLPPDVLEQVFALEPRASTVIQDLDGALLVQITEVVPVDATDPANSEQLERLNGELSGALANSLFQAYAQMLVDGAEVSVNQQLIEDTLALYP